MVVSYRKCQEVFTSKKKLKGCDLVLTESLTATRQAVLAKAKQAFGVRNCRTNDGRIYISAGEKVSVITSEKELGELKDSIWDVPQPQQTIIIIIIVIIR